MKIEQVIKPEVRALRAYTLSPHRASVKINQNENPWDAPARIKDETLKRFASRKWSRYPDFIPTELLEQLARFAGWRADGVLAGNGSNELIQALMMVSVTSGKSVLICEPTFTLYRQVATVLGGAVNSVSLSADFQFDVAALLRRMRELQPDVTIICSPNNPTGSVIDDSDLAELLKTSTGLVVVDEAYHEFSGHSVVRLLKEHDNLVVLRTFSKAMAMAAFRVGYLLSSQELVREIGKALLPYNLNYFSITAAQVALEMYATELRPLVEKIVDERDRVFEELKRLDGFLPVKSNANFMIVESRIEPKKVFSALLERDVLIRDVSSYPMLENYFRISVGTPSENDKLLQGLKEL